MHNNKTADRKVSNAGEEDRKVQSNDTHGQSQCTTVFISIELIYTHNRNRMKLALHNMSLSTSVF